MALYLSEIVFGPDGDLPALDALAGQVTDIGGTVIEYLVSRSGGRVFVIAETDRPAGLRETLVSGLGPDRRLDAEPVPVRLVGAELAELKARAPKAGYLVEWDLPAELTMTEYLERKRKNSAAYAEVPETSFLRTYVREDLAKCVCLYDAPDEVYVRKARAAVDAPVDRLHALDDPEPGG